MKLKIKESDWFIIITIPAFIAFYIYVIKKNKELEKNGEKNIGLVIELSNSFRFMKDRCKYIYFVNNHKYTSIGTFDQSHHKVKLGDFYEIIYNPDEKDYSEIFLDKKVIPANVCSYFDGSCPFEPYLQDLREGRIRIKE
jgi:hypothetical protein